MGYTLQATVARPYDRTVADVRAALADDTTVVEAFDPDAMTRLAGDALCEVAADARVRLSAALARLTEEN